MSVPKGKRNVSKVEFFHNAYKLREKIINVLLRDFGVKRIARDLKTFTHSAKMNKEDRQTFIELCDKYDIDVEAEFPLWLVDYHRSWILKLLENLINNITQANTIYPTSESEYYLRKKYQQEAIGNCYQLKQAMQCVVRDLPVNVEKYIPLVKEIDIEIEHLRNWRKSSNRILEAIQKKNAGKSTQSIPKHFNDYTPEGMET